MFYEKSRYLQSEQYQVRDKRGRFVKVVAVPPHYEQDTLGFHQLIQGQRLDHLANSYGSDPTGFWKIAELNDAMLPESLTEQKEIAIPAKKI